jgi:hypothetical protein
MKFKKEILGSFPVKAKKQNYDHKKS